MTISELIQQLDSIRETYGDIPVARMHNESIGFDDVSGVDMVNYVDAEHSPHFRDPKRGTNGYCVVLS